MNFDYNAIFLADDFQTTIAPPLTGSSNVILTNEAIIPSHPFQLPGTYYLDYCIISRESGSKLIAEFSSVDHQLYQVFSNGIVTRQIITPARDGEKVSLTYVYSFSTTAPVA